MQTQKIRTFYIIGFMEKNICPPEVRAGTYNKVNKTSAIRMKRKLKKFKEWIKKGKFTKEQAINSYYSWRGHMKRRNSYTIIKRMDKLVKEIY